MCSMWQNERSIVQFPRETLSEFFLTGKHLDKGQVDGGPKAWHLNINMYRIRYRYVTNQYGAVKWSSFIDKLWNPGYLLREFCVIVPSHWPA